MQNKLIQKELRWGEKKSSKGIKHAGRTKLYVKALKIKHLLTYLLMQRAKGESDVT